MGLHKITAGDGYEYLTRQVAVMDATERGHSSLASYYTQRGESPGCWVGAGLAGVEGLNAGDVVTGEQMRFLFGSGHHPLAAERIAALPVSADADLVKRVSRLGQPYRVYRHDIPDFRLVLARRFGAFNTGRGLPEDWPVPAGERARIRSEVGVEFFRAEYGRDPVDARELAAVIAKLSRPLTTAVAGFDLTFSPVKSVSTLWALADRSVSACVERAHQAAVADALGFIETHALFTREGTNGVRQVNVRGLVAAAFTHRDSRAGDPDLHTHVAVANKVQTLEGRWLSIDGRLLYKAIVTASEVYNTALENHLTDVLPVVFVERANPDPRKRSVRELDGIDSVLMARWSSRRAAIELRQAQLVAAFQADHHRPPTIIETRALAQQATLETRPSKHGPRSLAEQRATWAAEARTVLGQVGVQAMLAATLDPARSRRGARVDQEWIDTQAGHIVTVIEASRATWQEWHVRAEALRVVRAAGLATTMVSGVVDELTRAALAHHSVALRPPEEPVVDPPALRRIGGDSMYTVAGATWHTSARVLAAEHRLVEAAGLGGGYQVPLSAVDIALLEATANRAPLNTGQAALVRAMATSGCRLQLAIAPAGSGKTTAMRALATAWQQAGGTVIGMAPSAAAAAQLADQIGTHADTMALLTHALRHQLPLPDWAGRIGPASLVIIDEAGMADTLSLDQVVAFALDRGASVRLVGDDQQLAAIGAGGVLRDIETRHGALHLSELVRFADPAEGAASLALRDGNPDALGFYLDHRRIHVGDLTSCADQVFTSWSTARDAGVDAVMLAPTRDLVGALNLRAHTHLHHGHPHGRTVTLADGATAAVGDVIITRLNDRRLRTSGTDWVRNGDRWRVTGIGSNGAMRAVHMVNHQHVVLPASYVTDSVDLGYATTIHGAQGVTADVMHGILTGTETRQQLYTMLTRGRHANHVHLEVVGDGDDHTMVTPDALIPPTATDLLHRILSRDETAISATSTLRQATDPGARLADAAARYRDSLTVAAAHTAPTGLPAALDGYADTLHPGLTDAASWGTLRSDLLLLHAAGADPFTALAEAYHSRDLHTAADPAAVLAWRLDPTGRHSHLPGPLPWLPGIPTRLAEHPTWGPYLTGRYQHVTDLAAQVRSHALTGDRVPGWAPAGRFTPDPDTLADISVWRAAQQTPATDLRPTGEPRHSVAEARWQHQLDQRITHLLGSAAAEWAPLLHDLAPATDTDPYRVTLAHRLAQIHAVGLDARHLLHTSLTEGPLPDDHAAAALWWRLTRHLSPAVATSLDSHHEQLTTNWLADLTRILGDHTSTSLQTSPWWQALVTAIDTGLARGWRLPDLLSQPPDNAQVDVDPCQALVWRTSILLDPLPDPGPDDTDQELATVPVVDEPAVWEIGEEPVDPTTVPADPADDTHADPDWTSPSPPEAPATPEAATVEVEDLAFSLEALQRRTLQPLEISDSDLIAQLDRADAWHDSPHTPERLNQVNELAARFYQGCYRDSWARPYLTSRFHTDLTDHPHIRPGYAPAAWNALVTHLRRHGVTDAELLATGLATTASTGRLIDRFRDRVVLPIVDTDHILGFVGRRHPDRTDHDQAGPKYLNTADTLLYAKRAHLFRGGQPDPDATPVLVEGPMDAIAVTLASHGRYHGLAPLGTSLTSEQTRHLRDYRHAPIVATDADIPGQVAAHRDYWLLTPHLLHPRHAHLPAGSDPAQLVADNDTATLIAALDQAGLLADTLIEERLENLPAADAVLASAAVIAAQPVHTWEPSLRKVADRLALPADLIRTTLRPYLTAWTTNPARIVTSQLNASSQLRDRLTQAARRAHWTPLLSRINPSLLTDPDWPTLAHALDTAHRHGLPLDTTLDLAASTSPLNPARPAADLARRLTQLTTPEPDQDPDTPDNPAPPEPPAPSRAHPEPHNRRQI